MLKNTARVGLGNVNPVSTLTDDQIVSLGFLPHEAERVRDEFSKGPRTSIGFLCRSIRSFNLYSDGYRDRSAGRPCKSAHGTYLDGYYADKLSPDFLLSGQVLCLRLRLQRLLPQSESEYHFPRNF